MAIKTHSNTAWESIEWAIVLSFLFYVIWFIYFSSSFLFVFYFQWKYHLRDSLFTLNLFIIIIFKEKASYKGEIVWIQSPRTLRIKRMRQIKQTEKKNATRTRTHERREREKTHNRIKDTVCTSNVTFCTEAFPTKLRPIKEHINGRMADKNKFEWQSTLTIGNQMENHLKLLYCLPNE